MINHKDNMIYYIGTGMDSDHFSIPQLLVNWKKLLTLDFLIILYKMYSYLFLSKFDQACRVVCFEPSKKGHDFPDWN